MKVFLFTLCFSCLSFADEPPSPARVFCAKLESHVRWGNAHERLDDIGVMLSLPEKSPLGNLPKNSEKHFAEHGFKNILTGNPKLLSDEGAIPRGAIFILDKERNSRCPIQGFNGHIGVKCGKDSLFWTAGQTKKLSEFMRENPTCIKAIMYHPSWAPTKNEKVMGGDSKDGGTQGIRER